MCPAERHKQKTHCELEVPTNKLSLTVAALVACATLSFGCQDRPTAPLEDGRQGPQLAKGGKKGSQEPTQTVTFTFRDESDLIFGDGRVMDGTRTTYTSDECGVNAFLLGNNGNPTLRTKRYPIKRNEAEFCRGKEGRVFRVSFPDTGQPLDWDGQTMNAKYLTVYYQVRTIPLGQKEFRKLQILFDDQGERGGGGWGQACPWGLRFDNERWPGSSDVQVTRLKQQSAGDDYDEWQIEAGPEDVAVCLGGKDEPIVLGYYHMPFQMNVVCEGEC
jgi:hypothetical protein